MWRNDNLKIYENNQYKVEEHCRRELTIWLEAGWKLKYRSGSVMKRNPIAESWRSWPASKWPIEENCENEERKQLAAKKPQWRSYQLSAKMARSWKAMRHHEENIILRRNEKRAKLRKLSAKRRSEKRNKCNREKMTKMKWNVAAIGEIWKKKSRNEEISNILKPGGSWRCAAASYRRLMWNGRETPEMSALCLASIQCIGSAASGRSVKIWQLFESMKKLIEMKEEMKTRLKASPVKIPIIYYNTEEKWENDWKYVDYQKKCESPEEKVCEEAVKCWKLVERRSWLIYMPSEKWGEMPEAAASRREEKKPIPVKWKKWKPEMWRKCRRNLESLSKWRPSTAWPK